MNMKYLFSATGFAFSPVAVMAQGWRGNGCWGYGFPGMFGGGWMMIFWTALLVGLIFLIVRWASRSVPKRSATNNAMTILTERYAKGEISQEEYRKLKDDLS